MFDRSAFFGLIGGKEQLSDFPSRQAIESDAESFLRLFAEKRRGYI